MNPFPDKTRESKTWLSEDDGPITDVATLMARANYFSLAATEAKAVLADVVTAGSNWRAVALSPAVGLTAQELEDFVPAFEHDQLNAAKALLEA